MKQNIQFPTLSGGQNRKTEKVTTPFRKVAIMLATYNGADYLDAQLRTLAAQTHVSIDLWISDDGSNDTTLEILKHWQQNWPKGQVTILNGPRQGFAENFRSLLLHQTIQADYFAFCDQDDLWLPEKIRHALDWMDVASTAHHADIPLLHCERTIIMTDDERDIGYSPLFQCKPCFRNALVQSIAGGNTMLFNGATRELLRYASQRSGFVSHDWWAYMLVSGAGGVVHYSSRAGVRYRQHANNLVGGNRSWKAQIIRVQQLLRGRYSDWITLNIAGLQSCRDLLNEQAKRDLDNLIPAHKGGFFQRIAGLYRSGAFRQTLLGQAGLWFAVLTKRF